MFFEILVFFALLLYLLHVYISWKWDYWTKKNVPFMKPKPFFGSIMDIIFMRKTFFEFDMMVYNYFKGHKYGGYYEGAVPVLWIFDPELIKLITVKDFDHFVDRRSFEIDDHPDIKHILFGCRGQYWRDLRTYTTPTFTSGKMRKMFSSVTSCRENCLDYMKDFLDTSRPLDLKDTFGRFTVDVVASAAYGLQINSFKEPEAMFPKMAAKIVSPGKIEIMKTSLFFISPKLAKFLNIEPFNREPLDFLFNVTISTIERREKEGIRGNDFLQLLSDARKGELTLEEEDKEEINLPLSQRQTGKKKMVLSDEVISAQGVQFFFAGYETVSNFLTFLCYELAVNEDVQDRLREEATEVCEKYGGITYEAIQQMEYLDMVVDEVQRLHPALTRIDRTCTKDYKVPGSDLIIEKDTTICINYIGPNYDSEYFEDPERFDPERFSKGESSKRHPYVFTPFGVGPRSCIGNRFALMEIKSLTVRLITSMKFKTCDKTIIPLQHANDNGINKPNGKVYLTIESI